MSLSWFKRKARLDTLLQSQGDDDEDALSLDRLLHGQSVIGQTCGYPSFLPGMHGYDSLSSLL
jgi:hypothetical protein